MLEGVWELADRGVYKLSKVDALNVQTRIKINQGNKQEAKKLATDAFHLALCDDSPFIYRHGFQKAVKNLARLNINIPERYHNQTLPKQAELIQTINIQDEFYV